MEIIIYMLPQLALSVLYVLTLYLLYKKFDTITLLIAFISLLINQILHYIPFSLGNKSLSLNEVFLLELRSYGDYISFAIL